MLRYWGIRWRGIIARDVGYVIVEADTSAEARAAFEAEHGSTRHIVKIDEVIQ